MPVVLFLISIDLDDREGALKDGFFVDIVKYVLFYRTFLLPSPNYAVP